ncbi:MAG: hypothetical protein JWM91_324 [Rhodospirillales bacterium]|nr:hypothetical protein [Rhodospirillales bacterium]
MNLDWRHTTLRSSDRRRVPVLHCGLHLITHRHKRNTAHRGDILAGGSARQLHHHIRLCACQVEFIVQLRPGAGGAILRTAKE